MKRWARGVIGGAIQRFSSDKDERVNLEYAGWNSRDAMPTMKEDNRRFTRILARLRMAAGCAGYCFLGVVLRRFVNLFNINSIVQFNNVTVTTNANGELVGASRFQSA